MGESLNMSAVYRKKNMWLWTWVNAFTHDQQKQNDEKFIAIQSAALVLLVAWAYSTAHKENMHA